LDGNLTFREFAWICGYAWLLTWSATVQLFAGLESFMTSRNVAFRSD